MTARRGFLATIATGATVSVAGCGAVGDDEASAEEGAASVPPPRVESDRLDGWERSGQQSTYRGEVGGTSIYTKRRRWMDAQLQQQVTDQTLGQFDQPLAQFFAVTVDLRGLTAGFADESQIVSKVLSKFENRLNDAGVTNVSEGETGMPAPSLEDEKTAYRERVGQYRTPEIEKTVTIPDAGEQTITLDPQTLEIRGFVIGWKVADGRAFVAGGAHPIENFTASERLTVTGEKQEGIDIVVEVDISMNAEQTAREMNEFVTATTADWE